MLKIKETVIVEGRDDQAALARSVDAVSIATHGYGIRKETLDIIRKAYESQGIIIFTDPDRAGENIRKKLTELFPDAKQAFLSAADAEKDGDIGIENASPQSIETALKKARANAADPPEDPVSIQDLIALGLSGSDGASALRCAVSLSLGTGSCCAKTFAKRLYGFGIGRAELLKALENCIEETR